jgi:hypothetical protein
MWRIYILGLGLLFDLNKPLFFKVVIGFGVFMVAWFFFVFAALMMFGVFFVR